MSRELVKVLLQRVVVRLQAASQAKDQKLSKEVQGRKGRNAPRDQRLGLFRLHRAEVDKLHRFVKLEVGVGEDTVRDEEEEGGKEGESQLVLLEKKRSTRTHSRTALTTS
jgi:hypothetical protein